MLFHFEDNSSDLYCSQYAVCNNTVGSYSCNCEDGYYGDGNTCTGAIRNRLIYRNYYHYVCSIHRYWRMRIRPLSERWRMRWSNQRIWMPMQWICGCSLHHRFALCITLTQSVASNSFYFQISMNAMLGPPTVTRNSEIASTPMARTSVNVRVASTETELRA